MVHTEVQTIEAVKNQASTPKIWDRATTAVSVGDIIHAPFMPVMRVMNKQRGDGERTWLLIEPTNATCDKQWVEVEAPIPSKEETEFEQGKQHGQQDAAERLHPTYTQASCNYSAGYLQGYNGQSPKQTKPPTTPHWTVIYDGEYWYKAWVDRVLVGKATTCQKAEQMAQKAIASKKIQQEHREQVLASYAD